MPSKEIPIKEIDKEMKDVAMKSKGLLSSRYGLWFLGILSLAESMLLIPLITDPFMVAYILLDRSKAFVAVLVTTLTSLLGGLIAYITATFFIDIALGFLSAESSAHFYQIVERFEHSTFILGFVGAITPIPFTLSALAAGVIKGNLTLFIIGVLLGRSIRYGIAGYLAYKFGDDALRLARRNIKPISILTFILVIIYLWFIL